MKAIYQILDNKTGKLLSKKYELRDDAEKDLQLLRENVYHADISIYEDYIPDRRFTLWERRRADGEWLIFHDADTIAEAVERITYHMDLEDDNYPYDYRITHTGYPEFVVLTMETGEYYPHDEEREECALGKIIGWPDTK